MSRVIHFEIHADAPERAATFYTGLFGWEVAKWDGPVDYWMLSTGPSDAPGINGGLVRRRGPRPEAGQACNAFPCTMGVESVDASLAKAVELGGVVALPKMAVPGVGWLAYVHDPEGNIFGLMQADPTAA